MQYKVFESLIFKVLDINGVAFEDICRAIVLIVVYLIIRKSKKNQSKSSTIPSGSEKALPGIPDEKKNHEEEKNEEWYQEVQFCHIKRKKWPKIIIKIIYKDHAAYQNSNNYLNLF